MPDRIQLKQAYADLIHAQPWDLFSTVTYRNLRRDPIYAAKQYWEVLELKFSADRAFIAVEKHFLDGIHLHALSRHSLRPTLKPYSLWKYNFKAFGRNSVSEPRFASTALVTWYCAKYVIKEGFDNDNYFLYGDTWNKD